MPVTSVKSQLFPSINTYVSSWLFLSLLVLVHRNHKHVTVNWFTELTAFLWCCYKQVYPSCFKALYPDNCFFCFPVGSRRTISSLKLVNAMQRCVNAFHDIEAALHKWLMEHLPKVKETKASWWTVCATLLLSAEWICPGLILWPLMEGLMKIPSEPLTPSPLL